MLWLPFVVSGGKDDTAVNRYGQTEHDIFQIVSWTHALEIDGLEYENGAIVGAHQQFVQIVQRVDPLDARFELDVQQVLVQLAIGLAA